MKKIEVLRIGQRLVRDDRVTTHVALVARAFGASKIFMNEVNPEIKYTLEKVNRSWGGGFELEFIDDWKKILRTKKKSAKIVHLTMYGENVNDVQEKLRNEDEILVVVGAEKVPREVYDYADYNVAVGNQPHSEISALAIVLDRIQNGKQFDVKYSNARLEIVPSKKGKKVIAKSD
ncbi:MAG TPA: tRNA (cytidine(56)-2'-O)-methyltransferase [Candidatus Nitrosotenuis sp.]|jgi:tRNA (cytidine56-2'-O)-methyltransferase|nr:tRNA (cytidine(56)-2'-O)-methyltransferase [Candidatus Nitrosotenuis sp.]